MSIRCIVIDDEPPALRLLQEYISRIPGLQLTRTFEDAVKGKEYLEKEGTELLFIDINMPDISGLDLVRALAQAPLVIFTTAHKKFALEGFELNAVDYLLKPISFERFEKAVRKAEEFYAWKQHQEKQEAPDAVFVYSEYRLVKIRLQEIVYIESLEDYIRIHLDNGKPVMTLMTLKKMLEQLPPASFSRIHRSYIVASGKVNAIQGKKVRMANGAVLPVSDSYHYFIDEWRKV